MSPNPRIARSSSSASPPSISSGDPPTWSPASACTRCRRSCSAASASSCAGMLLGAHRARARAANSSSTRPSGGTCSWSRSATWSSPMAAPTWAMQHIASNQTAILNASAALWIALLATRGRRAHALDRRTLIGLVIGFAGTALIIWPRGTLADQPLRHAAADPASRCSRGRRRRCTSATCIRSSTCCRSPPCRCCSAALMMTALGFATGEAA